MAYSSSTLTTILIISTLLLCVGLVLGNDTDIRKQCDQTVDPVLCANCVRSDKSRGTDELPDITHAVIFCTWSKANEAYYEADGLLQNGSYVSWDVKLKRALTYCAKPLHYAEGQTTDAIATFEAKDYQGTKENLKKAELNLNTCANLIQEVLPKAKDIVGNLAEDMVIVNSLKDIALKLLSLIAP